MKTVKRYLAVLGPLGGLRALAAAVSGRTDIQRVQTAGMSRPVELRVPSSDVRVFKKIFLEREYDFKTSREPRVILDAGANIGLASVYFAQKYPQARIIAVEPEAGNFELLTRNVADYPNVVPVRAALWKDESPVSIVDEGRDKWGFVTEAACEEAVVRGGACDYVPGVTVDGLMRAHGLERIDVLKLDVEGAECEVFQTAAAWIDTVDALIVELHERYRCGCNRAFYNATNGFDAEWKTGESVYLSRGGFLLKP